MLIVNQHLTLGVKMNVCLTWGNSKGVHGIGNADRIELCGWVLFGIIYLFAVLNILGNWAHTFKHPKVCTFLSLIEVFL